MHDTPSPTLPRLRPNLQATTRALAADWRLHLPPAMNVTMSRSCAGAAACSSRPRVAPGRALGLASQAPSWHRRHAFVHYGRLYIIECALYLTRDP